MGALLAVRSDRLGAHLARGVRRHARRAAGDGVQHRVRRRGGGLRQHRPRRAGGRPRRDRRRGGIRQRPASGRGARVPVLQRPVAGHLAASLDRSARGATGSTCSCRWRRRRSSRCRTCISPPGRTARTWSGAARSARRSSRSNDACAFPPSSRPWLHSTGSSIRASRRSCSATSTRRRGWTGRRRRSGSATRSTIPSTGRRAASSRSAGFRRLVPRGASRSRRGPGTHLAVGETATAGRMEPRTERPSRSDRLHLHRRRDRDARERPGRRVGRSRRHDRRGPVGDRSSRASCPSSRWRAG